MAATGPSDNAWADVYIHRGRVITRYHGSGESLSLIFVFFLYSPFVPLHLSHLFVRLGSLFPPILVRSQRRCLGALPELSDIIWYAACEGIARGAGLHTSSPKALIYSWDSAVLGGSQVLDITPRCSQGEISRHRTIEQDTLSQLKWTDSCLAFSWEGCIIYLTKPQEQFGPNK